ncbi:MAG TPA: Uma2 family endonuclease [Solirubrobacteraceae bacterium]|jgi:Uma2 family endonuclease|nr:Uma2 family endonuclease [Solirubrobacteraceae bacterium]
MRTLILDQASAGFDELLERRRRCGADRHDEVWEGVYHMVPSPSGAHANIEWQLARLLGPLADRAGLTSTGAINLGEGEDDFRIPDGALHRDRATGVWHPTAALVIEVVSPHDESWEKLPYYAAHAVDEVLIVDPQERSVSWLALAAGEYREAEHRALINLAAGELSGQLEWPPIEAESA